MKIKLGASLAFAGLACACNSGQGNVAASANAMTTPVTPGG